jgi:hypothetical protein
VRFLVLIGIWRQRTIIGQYVGLGQAGWCVGVLTTPLALSLSKGGQRGHAWRSFMVRPAHDDRKTGSSGRRRSCFLFRIELSFAHNAKPR